jgi:hypothetical protein
VLHASDAEIADQIPPRLRTEDVGRFDVAVGAHAVCVRVVQRLRNLSAEVDDGGRVHATRLQDLGEGAPLDELHDDERLRSIRPVVVHGHDPGMTQADLNVRFVLKFLQERIGKSRRAEGLRVEHLEGQIALAEVAIAHLVDRTKAAAGEEMDDLVAAPEQLHRVARRHFSSLLARAATCQRSEVESRP